MIDYSFPDSLIAKSPASPRDSAKLLVFMRATGELFFDTFRNLPKYLPQNAVLVFNETKVIPARLTLQKQTGGKVRVLYLATEGETIKVMADRRLALGSKIYLPKSEIYFSVEKHDEKYHFLRPSIPMTNIGEVFERFGETPIPPYIKHSPLSEQALRTKYQSIFAKHKGSVAAPTASLHFTKRLFSKLKRHGVDTAFVTLHVNLGTFAPLTEEQLKKNRLHEEYFEIAAKAAQKLNTAKKAGRPIIAVGTTVVRTLESAAGPHGQLTKLTGTTDFFIREPYRFKFVDALITNFHVPKSSLLMLVSALTGEAKLLELYQRAITKKFRFFSFGDGMLII